MSDLKLEIFKKRQEIEDLKLSHSHLEEELDFVTEQIMDLTDEISYLENELRVSND